MAKTNEEKILETLEKILRVVGLQVGADKSLTERVNLLKLADIDNKTISEILNTTELTVRVLASQSKKKNNKK
jgi:hypothetical protein